MITEDAHGTVDVRIFRNLSGTCHLGLWTFGGEEVYIAPVQFKDWDLKEIEYLSRYGWNDKKHDREDEPEEYVNVSLFQQENTAPPDPEENGQ